MDTLPQNNKVQQEADQKICKHCVIMCNSECEGGMGGARVGVEKEL